MVLDTRLSMKDIYIVYEVAPMVFYISHALVLC